MTHMPQIDPSGRTGLRIVRHAEVSERLQVSSAKLFDMIARGQFPKPFVIVPGGRAVGWLESDVDAWIIGRHANAQEGLA
ncbi:helix-turn-helix transcriptional regulator [Sandarakinorhabdus oryzae]|uniref:helix-turn-helix transcriptional regulator n=1 Tax=Sandarakinorhabdus oryzae TaxID=2675220 RepID=UPI0012E2A575|nr:AlpA family phage regulatory protein [Sandarakinorhabdus oryzae]